jgi:putative nucleotidyltransferase with HDIG domain
MPRRLAYRDAVALAATALVSAGALGAGWVADAQRRERSVRDMHRRLVDLLLNALTADDPSTARHSRRVADLSFSLAQACGEMSDTQLATLRVAALLHDMGKIDDRFFLIVHSRQPLTPEQRGEIKHHPHLSASILQPLEPLHPGIQRIVSSHHECWDGSGYPEGTAGDAIPIEARIIAVADVFDAMAQPRRYKAGMPVPAALEKLREGAGKQFDPSLVRMVGSSPLLEEWSDIALRGQADERGHLSDPEPMAPAQMTEAGVG